MLIFISDLHLADRTGGIHYLPVSAFQGVFADVADQAVKAQSQEITLIYLGDVFDLVRTTAWFEVPEDERPWGIVGNLSREEQCRRLAQVEAHAMEFLGRIIKSNAETFEFLKSVADKGLAGIPVHALYLPGNHDRICNQFDSLRARVSQVLGLNDPNNPKSPYPPGRRFDSYYLNETYQTFARHGHEWDAWNIELPDSPSSKFLMDIPYETYMKIPIGEVIATELASKLAPSVYSALGNTTLTPAQRGEIAAQFELVDDVHPLPALIPWLYYQLHVFQNKPDDVQKSIKTGINNVLSDFAKLHYMRDWKTRTQSLTHFWHQIELASLIALGRCLSLNVIRWILSVVQDFGAFSQDDNFASDAAADFQRLDRASSITSQILYILYGHTHTPCQTGINVTTDRSPRVYLNTGTWRPVHRQTTSRNGFVSTKGITYSIFYHPKLDPGSQAAAACIPVFEAWTGALLEHPIEAPASGFIAPK